MSFLSPAFRRGLAAGAGVLLLAGSAVGIAAAQQTPTPSPGAATGQTTRPNHQAFLDALAQRLGISTDTLQQAIDGARTDLGLPANGQKPFFPGGPGGRGFGPGMHGRGVVGGELNAAAQAIGISEQQLLQELPGKSLAQVAQDHGKNPADVANALKDAANQRIDQLVSNGRLTADQADQQKQRVSQWVDQLVNQVMPERGQGMRGRGMMPRPGTPAPTSGA